MKKTIYSLGILALTAFSFASCQKELTPEKDREGKLVTVTFVAESTNTKSGVATEGSTSVSYKWTTDDVNNMKLFTVGEDSDGKEVLTEVTDAVVTKVSDTKLTITATLAEESVVRAYLSEEQTSGGAPRIMAAQSPLSNSFDPVADILISEDETVSGSMPEEGLIFNRQVVINKMTLHNLVEGEKVKKVILTSDKGLNGHWDGSKMVANSNGGNKLTLLYDDFVVSSAGTFPVYFVTMPNAGHKLSIEVQTDQKIYYKTIESTTLDFNLGEFTKFNVGLPTGTPVTGFVGGNYAIGNPDGTKIAVLWKSGDNNLKSIDVTKDSEGNLICAPNVEIKESIFTFAESTDEDYPGMFTIQDHNELYLYAASSGSNHLMAKSSLDADCYWDISQNADGSYSIVASKSSNRNVMQNNGSIFSCYASASQTAIVLYPAENVINDDTPLIEVTSENPIGVPAEGGSYTIQYILHNKISGEKIVFDPNVDWITDPEISDNEITFNVEAQESGAVARTGVITLSYEGAEDVEIEVNQAAGEGGVNTYTYVFTSKSWAATLDGTAANWSSGKDGSQMQSGRGVQITTGVSGANATSPVSFNSVSKIVVTYSTNADKGAGSIAVKVGTNAAVSQSVTKTGGTTDRTLVYDFSPEQSGTVLMTVNCTTNSIYIKSIAITAISTTEPVAPTEYTVTCLGVSNGTISASPTRATAGQVITLTATPASGYEFDSWDVKDASNTAITVGNNNTFTMPASNVSVSATFKAVQTITGPRYEKISAISEGSFLIVVGDQAASSTGSGLSVSTVTVSNNTIASDSTVDAYAITITSVGNNQYTLVMGEKYIGYKGSGTDLANTGNGTTNNYKWTITMQADGTALIKNVGTTSRFIGLSADGTQFKAYSTSNNGLSTYPQPTLYKYVSE